MGLDQIAHIGKKIIMHEAQLSASDTHAGAQCLGQCRSDRGLRYFARGVEDATVIGSTDCCRDKVITGSFDKTCKLWSTVDGKCYHTLRGHTAEIVSLCRVWSHSEHRFLAPSSKLCQI